jgi:oxygen-dependent protoporphyrinogen oxidase
VSLGFRHAEFEHPLDGFGFVVSARDGSKLMACTWTSTKFNQRAPEEYVLLRAFVGGPRNHELVNLPDDELLQLVREELRQIMGVNATPVLTQIYRWPGANPQYDVGHLERVDKMETMAADLPGLYFTGSAYRGVGLPDCIQQGETTAEAVIAKVSELASQRANQAARQRVTE